MNVEVRNEAHLDIAEGVAFYDRQGYGAGDYFYQRIFEDIDSLSATAGIHDRYFDVRGAKKLSEPASSDSFHIGQNEFAVRPEEQATFLMGRLGKLKCLKFDVAR
jgi:UDP-glucose 4-epimerase